MQVATAQFNQKGTVHLSIGIAGGAHNTQTKQTLHIFGVDLSKTTDSHAATVTFPIQVGVGLADFFSMGAFLEPGSYLDSSVTHSNSIVLYCLWALLEGSYQMTTMSAHTLSPATGLPLSYMYGIGVIMGVGMFGIIFVNLYRALFVAGAIDDLVVLRESEDDRDFSADTPHHDASQGDKK